MTGSASHQLCFLEPLFRLPTQSLRIIIFKHIPLVIARLHNPQIDVREIRNKFAGTFVETPVATQAVTPVATPAEDLSELSYVGNQDNCRKVITFYSYMLKFSTSRALVMKGFSLLPIAGHHRVHVNYSGDRTMHHLFLYVKDYYRSIGLPPSLSASVVDTVSSSIVTGVTAFCRSYQNNVFKDGIWNTIFNLEGVRPDRREEADEAAHGYRFNRGFRTDGNYISFNYTVPNVDAIDRIAVNLKELKTMKPDMDVKNKRTGFLELKKKPKGLKGDDVLVGIDPGIRSLVIMVDRQDLSDPEIRKNHSLFRFLIKLK